ncbi:MAG: valine--tRNA ligase [Promethearchaeota archaeon]
MEFNLNAPYSPEIEEDIYKFWMEGGYFRPETQINEGGVDASGSRFCLTLPPPNVTGILHAGHALTIAIEDSMVRFNRLRGKLTLFLPGTDHAGIATQNVVERELNKKGLARKELGRAAFIEKVWEWKKEYHSRITRQAKRLGMSADWSRERFTLDEKLSKAVREAFVRLYKKGLIYRGKYLVNWCPGRCESAISDLEAIPQEHKGHLWYIRYPIKNENWSGPQGEWGSGEWAKGATEFIEVATTRPETLLGDTGIATTEKHPEFKKFIGKTAILPVLGREIPIFTDPHVDPEFGTGAVKVTPAHDPNDYEMGESHDLEFITVLDDKGRMVPEYSGKYAMMDRFECRKAIVEDLEKEGLLVKIEPHEHYVAHCQRCDSVVEPRISVQWFVKTKSLAAAAVERVRNGETKIVPERERKRFFQWMENIRDWCISRQLWWGHRIPVWYCSKGHQICEREEPVECPVCGDKKLVQDEDVLDTWFSSGLWPFSTLGWPETDSNDFKRFYPTDVRETGYDILFFWVAREMMLGIELTGQSPYSFVYLHGIVRNEKGKKISKSMENIEKYDPLNIIKDYGADALRYTLLSNVIAGKDLNLDPRQFEAAKRFCNKIWQSTRFILSQLNEDETIPVIDKDFPREKLSYPDLWILSRLTRLVQDTTSNLENYAFLESARDIKNFFWGEFCDWYIEISKMRLYGENDEDKVIPKAVLIHILKEALKLLHPTMPFITEAIWQLLPEPLKDSPAIIISRWPEVNKSFMNEDIEEKMSKLIGLIREIRRARTDFNISFNIKIPLLIEIREKGLFDDFIKELCLLARLNPEELVIQEKLEAPKNAIRIVNPDFTAYMPLEGLIDLERERARIGKQAEKLKVQIQKIEKKLSGPFSQKAAPDIVEKERNKLKDFQEKLERLTLQLDILK